MKLEEYKLHNTTAKEIETYAEDIDIRAASEWNNIFDFGNNLEFLLDNRINPTRSTYSRKFMQQKPGEVEVTTMTKKISTLQEVTHWNQDKCAAATISFTGQQDGVKTKYVHAANGSKISMQLADILHYMKDDEVLLSVESKTAVSPGERRIDEEILPYNKIYTYHEGEEIVYLKEKSRAEDALLEADKLMKRTY